MASVIPVFGFTGNLILSKLAAVIVVLLGLDCGATILGKIALGYPSLDLNCAFSAISRDAGDGTEGDGYDPV